MSAQAQPGGIPPVNVVGFAAIEKDLTNEISIVGTLQANESIEIKSEINGTIAKINFEEGQRVVEDDLLFEIESRKLQAALDQAKANYNLAQTTTKRYENLVKTQAVSQQEYDETSAQLESTRASVALAQEQLEDATITAPFSGVIGERLVSVGQFISQGTALGFLYSQDPIKVEMHVPERYLGDIQTEQVIKIKVAAYKDKVYEGQVFFISPKIDQTTRTALVKAYVPNPSGELREGMFANVSLIVDVRKNALLIPERALIIRGDDVLVYTVGEDQTVSMKPVKTGKRQDGMVAITEGLSAGDVVVIEGYQKIGPGSKVNVRLEDADDKKIYEII